VSAARPPPRAGLFANSDIAIIAISYRSRSRSCRGDSRRITRSLSLSLSLSLFFFFYQRLTTLG